MRKSNFPVLLGIKMQFVDFRRRKSLQKSLFTQVHHKIMVKIFEKWHFRAKNGISGKSAFCQPHTIHSCSIGKTEKINEFGGITGEFGGSNVGRTPEKPIFGLPGLITF